MGWGGRGDNCIYKICCCLFLLLLLLGGGGGGDWCVHVGVVSLTSKRGGAVDMIDVGGGVGMWLGVAWGREKRGQVIGGGGGGAKML